MAYVNFNEYLHLSVFLILRIDKPENAMGSAPYFMR